MKNFKKFLFYLVLIIIPFLFFILLELTLRLFDYGTQINTWTNITKTHYGLNPNVAKRYFYSVKNVPESIQDVFAVQKKNNSYRIFVLGGSSAAGYPFMPLGSFSRYLQQRLEQNYPDKIIEVVNVSLTAVNSYTIRDLIEDVIEQNPDLVLIYAGHNEYYGALGVGSMESLGRSRTMVNLVLSLNKYRTVQLIRNILKSAITLFGSEKNKSGTLMSRMAQNQQIEYDSDTFQLGVEQFKSNMQDVITYCKEEGVPIILSTVASNLKDLKPFISGKSGAAINYFNEANVEYKKGNYSAADSLYRLAKDYDQLRFRAPELINKTVKELCNNYHVPYVDVDNGLKKISPNGIIGYNFMTDHLHPTLNGYMEIGNMFYEKINSLNLLPSDIPKYNFSIQDSITKNNFYFTKLDSTIADYKLRILKNDWPFINPRNKLPFNQIIKPTNFIDSLAVRCIQDKLDWNKAHIILGNYFIKKNELQKFYNEMEILISQYPIITEYYESYVKELLKHRDYERALKFLFKQNKISETHFSNKWIGNIELARKHYTSAIKYLLRSLEFNNQDSQVYYNLSGAYSQIGKYHEALNYINKCLQIDNKYSGANSLRIQLEKLVH